MAAGYTIYDLLRSIIRQVAWKSEQEMHVALQSVDEAESVNLWGMMAKAIECPHTSVTQRYGAPGMCNDCGKLVE